MSKPNEERDIYYIPPNFLASGRLFGGMIRARNAIEACVLVLLTGMPIIKLPMSLTVRIIILCLLPLPLGIFGIIGFEGDSLSEFAINWVRWFMSDIVKEEQRYQEENAHTEVVTVTTASKNLEDILVELKPTIEYDDGVSSGTLSLDHSTLKTEAAGYKRSSYTVTATKNYTGLDRNDSSYIDKTVEKNGRTLSLSNVTWSVESTALVGDELVPATYSAVATYSGSASSTVATGYITTAEYKGTVVSSGISSILYTVTYLGTKIEPTKAEPTFKGAVLVISIIGGTALLAALLFLGLTFRKNTTVYKATGKGNEYEKCGRLHLKVKNPELRMST